MKLSSEEGKEGGDGGGRKQPKVWNGVWLAVESVKCDEGLFEASEVVIMRDEEAMYNCDDRMSEGQFRAHCFLSDCRFIVSYTVDPLHRRPSIHPSVPVYNEGPAIVRFAFIGFT